jgi:hypothetical protein
MRCARLADKELGNGKPLSRRTWEVKTEGAARISAVVSAGRGQKRAGMKNPRSVVVLWWQAGEQTVELM